MGFGYFSTKNYGMTTCWVVTIHIYVDKIYIELDGHFIKNTIYSESL